jgi:uncharacterized membrane protein YhaH (DUF805 family)
MDERPESLFFPQGRIGRMSWLLRQFGSAVVIYLLMVVSDAMPDGPVGSSDLFLVLAGLAALAFVAFRIVQDIKRLHDLGRSGWYCLLVLVPFVGFFYLLVLLFKDGQPFTNEYGPDPKGRGVRELRDVGDVGDWFR